MSDQAQHSDVETLHKLGYAQELRRRMGGFSNFAISFTIISILFLLPSAAPGNTLATFSFAPVAVGVVILYAAVYWFVSAKNWFKGPEVQGTPEELARIEAELEAVGQPVVAGAAQ